MEKILVLDNYDSFTYNLVHYLEDLGESVDVFRNDQITVAEAGKYRRIVLSPGPGIPEEAGILKELIRTYAPTHNIFGVCLGQQAIGEVFGGTLLNLDTVYHGIATTIKITGDDPLYYGLGETLEVGRYHSWVVEARLPDCLEATSVDPEGRVMSLRHREYNLRGVQYHPESVLTPKGKKILENWLKIN